ncbi:MAG: cell division protein FtsA [Candidatus Cryptobacteroides sp.]|nr:cell division protein FtsA [Candidatus Cryptobacteroides sp.]
MEERYIASVDLGTSKLAVCVARIQDQNVEVIYYKESPSLGIRYSYVLIPGKVKEEVRKAISEAQQALRIKIQQVIVGLPRWYVRQETASASMTRPEPDDLIQESEIKALKSMALESYPLEDSTKEVIYGAVAQSFSTEDSINEPENDIVGMAAETLEGNFKVFIGNRRYSSNIDSVFNDLGIAIAKKYFTPGITAKAVLKSEQMENGVALIDIGAGVSSVTIFKDKIMRFYAAIPFGGNSVTNDIKSECNFSFELAENIKKAYGACMPNKLSSLGEKSIQIVDEDGNTTAQVSVKYISEIITARMKEIIEALLFRIQESGFASEEDLRAGVVVTGGGAELVNCANYIKELSGYTVKVGRPRKLFSCEGCPEASETSAATSMGMILSARNDRFLNCVNEAVARNMTVLQTGSVEIPEEKEEATPVQEVVEDIPETGTVIVGVEEVVRQKETRQEEPEDDYDPYSQTNHPTIEETVASGREEEDERGVFDPPTPEEIKEYKNRKREKKEKEKKHRSLFNFTWTKHIKETVAELYDDMNNEEV